MSNISISADSINAIAMESQASGAETIRDNSTTVMSSADNRDVDTAELSAIGTETVSRTQDYIGSGTDFSSTGTDVDVQHAVSSAIMSGTGSIADKIV